MKNDCIILIALSEAPDRLTSELSFEVQQSFSGFNLRDPQSAPNQSFQRTQQSITPFASAKIAPLCCAAELRR